MKPLKPTIGYIITFKGVPEEDTSPEPLNRQWRSICYPWEPTQKNILLRKKDGWATRPVLCIPCDLVSVAALQKKAVKAITSEFASSETEYARNILSKIHPVLGAKPRA